MVPSPPTESEANASSTAAIADLVATANADFQANATLLINNAITAGFYSVSPFVVPYLNIGTVTTYFQSFGYTVQFPICGSCNCSGNAGYPYEPCFVAGFPEVLPPGYAPWNCCPDYEGPSRIKISWWQAA
jgi:hypothetical protein